MRALLRAFVAIGLTIIVLSISLYGYHRDDWRDHVDDIAPPVLHKYIPEAMKKKPAVQPLEYGSLPWLGKVEVENLPYPMESEKAIVMAKLANEDTSWVAEKLPDWKSFIYTVDDQKAPLHTSTNKGREALAYLTFIIDYYAKLPRTIAFVHSHEGGYPRAWHADNQDYSNVETLQALQLPYVQEEGYVNLRCNTNPGCPFQFQLGESGGISEEVMRDAWQQMFGDAPLPRTIGAACCSQFAVSKEQIRSRSEDDYRRIRSWLLETPLADHVSGRILEFVWHIVFQREPVFCPPIEECYCNVFGACPE